MNRGHIYQNKFDDKKRVIRKK